MSDNNDSDDNKIRDLPSVQEGIRNAKTISAIREIYPKAKPILSAAGVDTTTIEHTLESTQNCSVEWGYGSGIDHHIGKDETEEGRYG